MDPNPCSEFPLNLLFGRFIKDELETMQAFLMADELIKKKDMLLKVWAKQVRDLSYNIEDCLDEFMAHVGSQSLSRQLMKLKDRHRIALQIRNLKCRVEEVSSRNTRYSLIKMNASNTIEEVDSYIEDVRNHSASNVNDAELVGFEKPKKELINLIDANTKDGPAKVICVVGMGGLGKTTLTKKAYESKQDIGNNFSCCAWITVSQSFFKLELVQDIIRQLLGVDSLKRCLKELVGKVLKVEDLAKYLRTELSDKRYFIVLDDMWNIHDWNWIYGITIPHNNNKGSRIIVTTQDVGLAKECTSETLIYHHQPLQMSDTIDLLLRKSRKRCEDMQKDKNRVKQLVKKCGRVPLAILTIGGILSTKKVVEWRQFYNQLPSELENNPSLEAVRRMVTLSYNHLPSHLKPCFLYLSIFPEDFVIQIRCLVERWIAEGLVKGRVGLSIEDVGKGYVIELINRNMIQPSRVNIEGSIKSCRVHDIMRDVMVSISREENFVSLMGNDITNKVGEKARHIAYHGSKCSKMHMDQSHVRSLSVFGGRPVKPPTSLCSSQLKMLRVLDLQNAQFVVTQKDINNIWLFHHLMYVNIRCLRGYPKIHALPTSIGKQKGLQVLDLRDTRITTIPTEICKLQNLRSLRCSKSSSVRLRPYHKYFPRARKNGRYSDNETKGVKVPRGIGNLNELHILEVVDIRRTSCKAIEELGELVQLTKLSVTMKKVTSKKCKVFCAALQKLFSLRSLTLDSISKVEVGTLKWLDRITSPPALLSTFRLRGHLGKMPSWFGNLMHLAKIYLEASELEEGQPTEILGALPSLMLLHLDYKSYVGEKLLFTEEAFPNLRRLYVSQLWNVKEVKFEEGSSPQMERIQIWNIRSGAQIVGVKHLPIIREIKFGKTYVHSPKVVADKLQEEVSVHPNHPLLLLE
ncbi:unnamed protein product [Triticum turgidum subsp. durum]|uniref:Uncharacterized protein n=1 Tax=Triticum turgidum subsp. durum TaxID=4567 RepID=A0A9R0SPN2_TRITD|nr:unnamed protein product [Triticum turgidum subsp. durum]